jgi:hypothetical protein
VGHHTEVFVGIDTSKSRNEIAIADGGRGGEVRYLGEFPSTEAAIRKLMAKLAAKYRHLTFCYEAEPTRYGLYRLLKSLGHGRASSSDRHCTTSKVSLADQSPFGIERRSMLVGSSKPN